MRTLFLLNNAPTPLKFSLDLGDVGSMARRTLDDTPDAEGSQSYDPYSAFVVAARQKAAALDAALLDPFSVEPMQGDIEPFQRVKLVVSFRPRVATPTSGFESQTDLYAATPCAV